MKYLNHDSVDANVTRALVDNVDNAEVEQIEEHHETAMWLNATLNCEVFAASNEIFGQGHVTCIFIAIARCRKTHIRK